MKRIFPILIFCLVQHLVSGQSKTIGKDNLLFEQGLLLQQLVNDELGIDDIINSKENNKSKQELAAEFKEAILNKSLEYYQELLDSFPKSKLLFRTLNNKGFIELALEDKAEAKKTFLKILESKADDKEKGGIGSGIMAEPYANYKNRACKVLAEIYIADSNYKDAIKYLDETKQYPYRHFCGNEYASNRIYMCSLYAKCYIGLRDNKRAIEVLLPELLENGLADNSDVVELAYTVLSKEYSKNELKLKFETAFKNYTIEKVRREKDEYEMFYIYFLDTKLRLSSWRLDGLEKEKLDIEIEKTCKNSKFYRLLNM